MRKNFPQSPEVLRRKLLIKSGMAVAGLGLGTVITKSKADEVANNIERTVAEKLRDTVFVEDFGAKGDGTTDDSIAIQNALNYGGLISGIKGKTYIVTRSMIIKNDTTMKNIKLKMAGVATNYTIAAIINSDYKNNVSGNQDICIKNVEIEGFNKTKQNIDTIVTDENRGIGGIYLGFVKNCAVINVSIYDTWSGITIYNVPDGTDIEDANNHINKCSVYRAHAWSDTGNSGTPRGIYFGTGGTLSNTYTESCATGFFIPSDGGIIENCVAKHWFYDNGYYVIGRRLSIVNCRAYGNNLGSGFAIAYNQGSLISGNYAQDCANMGFRIHVPQSKTRFIGNHANGCGYGFRIDNASFPHPEKCVSLIISNNIAEYSEFCGFQFQQLSNSIIESNIACNNQQEAITKNTRGAIAFLSECHNNIVQNNITYDDQDKPTQTDGFYNYDKWETGAENKNSQNKISHSTITGTDKFGPEAIQMVMLQADGNPNNKIKGLKGQLLCRTDKPSIYICNGGTSWKEK